MNDSEAVQLWGRLGSEGKAPTELSVAAHVLPSYTVGIDSWIDRLSIKYLRGDGRREGLSRGGAHFKLVLAPYGGGKTHFLLALGVRAREEGFSVSYLPCSKDISLASPLEGMFRREQHTQPCRAARTSAWPARWKSIGTSSSRFNCPKKTAQVCSRFSTLSFG